MLRGPMLAFLLECSFLLLGSICTWSLRTQSSGHVDSLDLLPFGCFLALGRA